MDAVGIRVIIRSLNGYNLPRQELLMCVGLLPIMTFSPGHQGTKSQCPALDNPLLLLYL